MRLGGFLNYRFAEAVLNDPVFVAAKNQLVEVLSRAPVPLLDPERESRRGGVKHREREPRRGDPGKRYFFLPVDQKALNAHLDVEFKGIST